MTAFSAGVHPDMARKIGSASMSVCTAATIAITTTWLFAGTTGVAWCRPSPQPAAASYSGVIKVFPASPATVAAIDEENDGDDDQADPEDSNDTVAAADTFPWVATDAAPWASQPGRKRFPSDVVQAA